jgi:hypothetical protein
MRFINICFMVYLLSRLIISCDLTNKDLCQFEKTSGIFVSPDENINLEKYKDTFLFCQNEKIEIYENIKAFHYKVYGIKLENSDISGIKKIKLYNYEFKEYQVHLSQRDYLYYFDSSNELIYMRRTDWNIEEYCNLNVNEKKLNSLKHYVNQKLVIPPP